MFQRKLWRGCQASYLWKDKSWHFGLIDYFNHFGNYCSHSASMGCGAHEQFAYVACQWLQIGLGKNGRQNKEQGQVPPLQNFFAKKIVCVERAMVSFSAAGLRSWRVLIGVNWAENAFFTQQTFAFGMGPVHPWWGCQILWWVPGESSYLLGVQVFKLANFQMRVHPTVPLAWVLSRLL